MNIWIKAIQKLVNFNEVIFFYPRLKKYYLKQKLGESITIIDVGANKGQSIKFFLSLYPKATIYSFEPNPTLYQGLVSKYENNPRYNVKIIKKGVSNTHGKLILQETVLDETSTLEELNYNSAYLRKKAAVLGVSVEKIVKTRYEIEVTTLIDFIKSESLQKIDILKIDTEGHELNVLKGLFPVLECPITYIQIESHNDDMYLQALSSSEIDNLLKKNNFDVSEKIKHGFGDFEEIIYKS